MESSDQKYTESNAYDVVNDLKDMTNASMFVSHARQVREFHAARMDRKVVLLDAVAGKIWTNEELNEFRVKGKEPTAYNFLKDTERAFVGNITANKYDITFSPFTPNKQKIADVLKQRYIWEAYQMSLQRKDMDLTAIAWATGSAYQEVYVEAVPGKKPIIKAKNSNILAVYWDPNSRDLGSRADAAFVDREAYMSYQDLCRLFPEIDFSRLRASATSYETINQHADKLTDFGDRRNGQFKVTERFYKVKERLFYSFDEMANKVSIDKMEREAYLEKNPNSEIFSEEVEYLYSAIVCPAFSTNEFLKNGPYHCQPRHPRTQEVMWPIIELISEATNYEESGYVEHMMDPLKAINMALSNIQHSARHNVSVGYLVDPSQFANDAEAKKFERYRSEPDRNYRMKADADLANAVRPIPRAPGISQDHMQILEQSMNFLQQASSTPPALKGLQESANTSGILNGQRIQQSFVQLQRTILYLKDFLRRRAELLLAYWMYYNEAFKDETIKILDTNDSGNPEFVTLNHQEPVTDSMGNWTGVFETMNDPTEIDYDVYVAESMLSPSHARLVMDDIIQLLSLPAMQADPGMLQYLLVEYMRLSDCPQDLKDKLIAQSAYMEKKKQEQEALATQQQQAETTQVQVETRNAAQAQAGADADLAQDIDHAQQNQQMPPAPAA